VCGWWVGGGGRWGVGFGQCDRFHGIRLFCVVILVVCLAVGPGCERQDAGGCH